MTDRVDLLGLGRAIERLVAPRIADAPVVGGGDPVAAALTRIEGGLHRPLECAAGLERAADLLAGAGASPAQAPSRSAEAALSLRDAARVLRRQAPLLDIPPPPI